MLLARTSTPDSMRSRSRSYRRGSRSNLVRGDPRFEADPSPDDDELLPEVGLDPEPPPEDVPPAAESLDPERAPLIEPVAESSRGDPEPPPPPPPPPPPLTLPVAPLTLPVAPLTLPVDHDAARRTTDAAGRGSGDVFGSVVDSTCHASRRISDAVREVGGLPGRGHRCRNGGTQRVARIELDPGGSAAGQPSKDKRGDEKDANRCRSHPGRAVPPVPGTKPTESGDTYEPRDRYQAQTQRGMNTRATYLTVWKGAPPSLPPTYRL